MKLSERSVYDHIANYLREKFNTKVPTEGETKMDYFTLISNIKEKCYLTSFICFNSSTIAS